MVFAVILSIIISVSTSAQGTDFSPLLVSPGNESDSAIIEQLCPTFSWTAVDWAIRYQVAVFETEVDAQLSYEQMAAMKAPWLLREISGRAFSWTPSAIEQLSSGRNYSWYVKAIDQYGNGNWSQGRRFSVETTFLSTVVEEVLRDRFREQGLNERSIDEAINAIKSKVRLAANSGVDKGPKSAASGGEKGLEGASNTFYGVSAGMGTTGIYNSFFGAYAGSSSPTGYENTFSGAWAGFNNTSGSANTFSGRGTGYFNTTGTGNTFTGYFAGYSNSTGYYNTFSGINAGYSNTTGYENTFSGRYAGLSNTTGTYNTFSGVYAGYSNTTGGYNTFSGVDAGYSNTTGSGNVFFGYRAGFYETTSNKLYIANSDTTSPLIYGEFDNNIVRINGSLLLSSRTADVPAWIKVYGAADNNMMGMGFDSFGSSSGLGGGSMFRYARGTQAAKVAVQDGDRLGFFVFSGYDGTNFLNTAGLTAKVEGSVSTGHVPTRLVFETNAAGNPRLERMVISSSGNIGIGVSTPAYPLQLGNGAYVTTGGAWTDASSREYKDNIEVLTAEDAFDTLRDLNPVRFAYKADRTEKHVGFIAEEVPELIAAKDRKGISPMDIVAVLTKVMQEQQKTMFEQQKTIHEQQGAMHEQQGAISILSKDLKELRSDLGK
jgi:hypothetical protein